MLRCNTFFYLYLMQGVPAGFALTAIANYLVAQGQTAQVTGKFVALVGFPWALQFLWGPFIDSFQSSSMGQRRPWVLVSQVLSFVASLALLWVDQPVRQLELLSFSFFAHSMFASLQDASVDAMAISVTPVSERGRVNAFMRGGMLIGTSLGAGLMAISMHKVGFFYTALMQSVFLFILTVFTFFIRENKKDSFFSWKLAAPTTYQFSELPEQSISRVFKRLFKAIFSRATLPLFACIALVYTCLSIFIRAFNVHLIQQLRWTDTYLSSLSGTYLVVGSLSVIFISGLLADRIGAQRMIMVIMAIICSYLLCFNLLSPLWENKALSSGGLLVFYLFDPSFSVAAMPMLMHICRKGIEGSQFTTYMSLVNFCDVAGAYVSGYALLWLPAPTIGILCGISVFAAILYIYFSSGKIPAATE